MAKLNLKQNKTHKKESPFKGMKLYLSNFMLTDNKNFALFDVNKHFLVDNEINDPIISDIKEEDLSMIIDRSSEIVCLKGVLSITFKNKKTLEVIGTTTKSIFDIVTNKKNECVFFMVTEWYRQKTNLIIAVSNSKYEKPNGIIVLNN